MARKRKGLPINGWINFKKPLEMTSTQAVGKNRWLFQAQKAGHAGTLDPLATGVLPIALGEATKTIPYIQDASKTYRFTVTWGEQRATDDAEGDVIATSNNRPSESNILSALPAYIGGIEQVPPKFSAIKIDGQRAYDLARDGQEFEIKKRPVYIESLELVERDEHTATFLMDCGKGTYVRSIARDLAIDLDTYGYVSMLIRERVGSFSLNDTISLEVLENLDHSARLDQALMPLECALDDIPALQIGENEYARLRHGNALHFVSRPDFERLKTAGIDTTQSDTALVVYNTTPVAIVTVEKAQIKPIKVFNM